MRVQVSDGVWIDIEKFDKITLNEMYTKTCYGYDWIWKIDIFEKNDVLIASMSFERGSTAKRLVDEMYNVIKYETDNQKGEKPC